MISTIALIALVAIAKAQSTTSAAGTAAATTTTAGTTTTAAAAAATTTTGATTTTAAGVTTTTAAGATKAGSAATTAAGGATTTVVVPTTECDGGKSIIDALKAARECTIKVDAKCTDEATIAGRAADATDEAKKIACDCLEPNAKCFAEQKCVTTPAPPKVSEEDAKNAKEMCEKMCGEGFAACEATAAPAPGEADSAVSVVLSFAAVVAAAFNL